MRTTRSVRAVDDTQDLVATLANVEQRLRELAYERLRAAAEDGDADAVKDEKKLLQARRAVEKAIRALGGTVEE
jgi:hypothetical protein